MICLDTSVVVAGFGAWHERHVRALELLADKPRIAAHTALETYSVLTRLPPPARAPAAIASEFLARRFPEPALVLGPRRQRTMVGELAEKGITGGRVYDALIALTAREADAVLMTLDRRALSTYLRCGVEARLA